MDIKLVPYADKVAGSSTAAGQVSADDLNQIKKILNAIVAALFDLDQAGVATTGIVKLATLPPVDLVNYFSADFTVSNGVLALATGAVTGGTTLPIPAAPTAFVADDVQNTANVTLPAGYAATDCEKTTNGGTNYSAVTSLPLSIGDQAYAIGQVGIRVKATSEHQHSATVFNQTAYTASVGNVDAGFTPVTNFVFANLGGNPGMASSGNNITFAASDTVAGNTDFGYANVHALKVPNGQPFELRFDQQPTSQGLFVGMSDNSNADTVGRNSMDFFMRVIRVSNSVAKIFVRQTPAMTNYFSTANFNVASKTRCRMRGTGSRVYAEYSLDGGTTWVDTSAATVIAQPAHDLYINIAEEYDSGHLENLLQSGFVAV